MSVFFQFCSRKQLKYFFTKNSQRQSAICYGKFESKLLIWQKLYRLKIEFYDRKWEAALTVVTVT